MRVCALALMMIFEYANADFTVDCPMMCYCKWQSGNKAADCSQRELNEVPDKLSSEIQNIDLSNNPLINISPRAFDNVGLCNLKKLRLDDCKLSYIDKDGFSGLSIMTELDLSKNNIKTLHPNTFNETIKLRHLIISENKLERIEDGLFKDLPYLQKIDLRNNCIYMLGTNSFRNLPMLKTIFLEKNNLSHVKLETMSKLKSIVSIILYDNPWKCDCYLRPFRDWTIYHNINTQQTGCAEPESLRNRLWIELTSEDFACIPRIFEPFQGTTPKVNGRNITLSCYVGGDPTPEVNWIQNYKILGYNSTKNHVAQRYEIKQTKAQSGFARWTNLTIISVEYEDSGEYTCIAKNRAGVDQRTVSLNVSRTPVVSTGVKGGDIPSNTFSLFIWVMETTVVIILIVVLSLFIYCKSRHNNKAINLNKPSSKCDVLEEVPVKSEMQKILVTNLNVMNKPLKKYNMPSALKSGAMSKAKRGLLEEDTVYTPNEDVNHYIVLSNLLPKHAWETVSVHSARADDRALHTPTIMSIVPTRSQASPAPSKLSSESNSTRLPLQAQAQSSLNTPTNIYENLPYTRSYFPVAKESVYENISIRKTVDGNSKVFLEETKL